MCSTKAIGVGAQLGDDEHHLLHQAADEVNVSAQPVELSNDDGRPGLASGLQCGGKLRPAVVVMLARLHLSEGLGDPKDFLISKTLDRAVDIAHCHLADDERRAIQLRRSQCLLQRILARATSPAASASIQGDRAWRRLARQRGLPSSLRPI